MSNASCCWFERLGIDVPEGLLDTIDLRCLRVLLQNLLYPLNDGPTFLHIYTITEDVKTEYNLRSKCQAGNCEIPNCLPKLEGPIQKQKLNKQCFITKFTKRTKTITLNYDRKTYHIKLSTMLNSFRGPLNDFMNNRSIREINKKALRIELNTSKPSVLRDMDPSFKDLNFMKNRALLVQWIINTPVELIMIISSNFGFVTNYLLSLLSVFYIKVSPLIITKTTLKVNETVYSILKNVEDTFVKDDRPEDMKFGRFVKTIKLTTVIILDSTKYYPVDVVSQLLRVIKTQMLPIIVITIIDNLKTARLLKNRVDTYRRRFINFSYTFNDVTPTQNKSSNLRSDHDIFGNRPPPRVTPMVWPIEIKNHLVSERNTITIKDRSIGCLEQLTEIQIKILEKIYFLGRRKYNVLYSEFLDMTTEDIIILKKYGLLYWEKCIFEDDLVPLVTKNELSVSLLLALDLNHKCVSKLLIGEVLKITPIVVNIEGLLIRSLKFEDFDIHKYLNEVDSYEDTHSSTKLCN